MDYDDLPDVLTVIQEMMQTDRAFFAMYRFLDADTRTQLLANQQRNTNNVMTLLRNYMALVANRPAEEAPARIVMNIPITMDASGNFWDPITVRPTVEQIRTAVEREVPVTNETCAICQESVAIATRIRHCGHCFHANCINEWFSQNARCPVCRHDIREQ